MKPKTKEDFAIEVATQLNTFQIMRLFWWTKFNKKKRRAFQKNIDFGVSIELSYYLTKKDYKRTAEDILESIEGKAIPPEIKQQLIHSIK